ncbi:MAG: hypothetical protein HOQ29_15040 [Acidobacteria bacterium]|nr:hypothetical protein [Acidobacteriota bacterium]
MKKAISVLAATLFLSVTALAADKTWNGTLSDNMCGAKHAATEEHGAKKMTESDCVKACVEGHDAKYVFLTGGKTYKIDNQDFADLKAHAGHKVALTGEMKGDTIKVSKIEMPAKGQEKK